MQWTFGNFSSEFHFGQEICVLLKIKQRWRQHTACVRLCFSLAFSIFQIKMEPINSHFLTILGKKGTFRNQWQSLINSLKVLKMLKVLKVLKLFESAEIGASAETC